ncbi:hypothetical protein T484DRAFT_3628581, partial [Baffinella frigidus]
RNTTTDNRADYRLDTTQNTAQKRTPPLRCSHGKVEHLAVALQTGQPSRVPDKPIAPQLRREHSATESGPVDHDHRGSHLGRIHKQIRPRALPRPRVHPHVIRKRKALVHEDEKRRGALLRALAVPHEPPEPIARRAFAGVLLLRADGVLGNDRHGAGEELRRRSAKQGVADHLAGRDVSRPHALVEAGHRRSQPLLLVVVRDQRELGAERKQLEAKAENGAGRTSNGLLPPDLEEKMADAIRGDHHEGLLHGSVVHDAHHVLLISPHPLSPPPKGCGASVQHLLRHAPKHKPGLRSPAVLVTSPPILDSVGATGGGAGGDDGGSRRVLSVGLAATGCARGARLPAILVGAGGVLRKSRTGVPRRGVGH